MQKCILIFINVKGILALIMPFWVPVQAHNSGLPCAALQEKWLYSMCKEAEYVPTQTCSCTVFQLSSDRIMHCGCTLLLLRLLSRQKKGKKKKKKNLFEGNVVLIVSSPMPAVSERDSCVSLYTDSGRLSNLLWWNWVCVVNPANDLWLRLSQSPEHAHTLQCKCLFNLFGGLFCLQLKVCADFNGSWVFICRKTDKTEAALFFSIIRIMPLPKTWVFFSRYFC